MANICTNDFYFCSEDESNVKYVFKFIDEHFDHWCEAYSDYVEGGFDSRWTFPEHLMNEMYKGIPNKSDVYARCLSYEYGCDYVEYWKMDEEGWYNRL